MGLSIVEIPIAGLLPFLLRPLMDSRPCGLHGGRAGGLFRCIAKEVVVAHRGCGRSAPDRPAIQAAKAIARHPAKMRALLSGEGWRYFIGSSAQHQLGNAYHAPIAQLIFAGEGNVSIHH
jgi:hypothetical protein